MVHLTHLLLVHSNAASAWLPALAGVLVASLWQGLALTMLAGCALRLLPGLSAAARAHLWAVVLLVSAALPLASLLPSSATPTHPALWHAGQLAASGVVPLLIALWLAASTFRLAQLMASALRLRRILRGAQPVATTPAIQALLRSSPRPATLCTSPGIDRPGIAGFSRPRILVPPALLAVLSQADLTHLLLHEREHLQRHDDWINLLGQLTLVVFPLNPVFPWLNRRLAQEREHACDDGVLRATAAPRAYAACLARVAESSLGSVVHRGLTLAIGLLGGADRRPQLTRRVERILAAPPRSFSRNQTRLAIGAIGAALLSGAAVLARTPELVSFTPLSAPSTFQAAAGNALSLPMSPNFDASATPGASTTPGGSATPSPLLVKAVMPRPSRAPFTFPASTWPTPKLKRASAHRHGSARGVPHLQRTAWPADTITRRITSRPAIPARIHLTQVSLDITQTVPQNSAQILYAAFPWQGGWLLLQI